MVRLSYLAGHQTYRRVTRKCPLDLDFTYLPSSERLIVFHFSYFPCPYDMFVMDFWLSPEWSCFWGKIVQIRIPIFTYISEKYSMGYEYKIPNSSQKCSLSREPPTLHPRKCSLSLSLFLFHSLPLSLPSSLLPLWFFSPLGLGPATSRQFLLPPYFHAVPGTCWCLTYPAPWRT